MRGFLRRNWMWIVLPIGALIVALVVIAILGRAEDTSPFQYGSY